VNVTLIVAAVIALEKINFYICIVYKGASTLCHMALPNGIAKGDVDFLLAQAIWQSFANWHAKPYPSTVGQDQRKPNGKMKYGRANVGFL